MAKAQKQRSAKQNAARWLASIEEMLAELHKAEDGRASDKMIEEARQRIEESILSVQVRSGWYSPGASDESQADPEEFEILLTTGGPALRIWGELEEGCRPRWAELQMQDWGTPRCAVGGIPPWTRYPAPEATLLAFAQCFWFGD